MGEILAVLKKSTIVPGEITDNRTRLWTRYMAEADEQDRRDAEERDLRRDLPTIPDLGGKQVAVQPIWGWADVMY